MWPFHVQVSRGEAHDIRLFVVWLIANNVGGSAPLEFDPVNFWAAALVLAIAIDLNRPRPELGHGKA